MRLPRGNGEFWESLSTISIPLFLDAIAWWVLFPKADRLPLRQLFWMRWIGESISALVPSAASAATLCGRASRQFMAPRCPSPQEPCSLTSRLAFLYRPDLRCLDLCLLVTATGKNSFVGPTLIGIVVALFAFAGFYFVQRRGIFRFLARIISRLAGSSDWQSLVQGGDTLDRTVRSLYARRSAVVACCACTMASLVLGSGEIWLALWFLDLPDSFLNALILQSMVLTIRSAAFAVPAGSGSAGRRLSCGREFAWHSG